MHRILDIGTKCISACGLALVIGIPSGGAHATDGYRTIHRFEGGANDGSDPSAGVIPDSMGNLYGTTYWGGGTGCGGSGCGILFKLTPSGGKWIETVLYVFSGGSDGGLPVSVPHLTMDASGNLYGTTFQGGQYGDGVVFEFGKNGEQTLYSFKGGRDGANPWAAPIFDRKGNLYGTTTAGGTNNEGTVYKLGPHGEDVLHSFGEGTDGNFPADGLIADKNGNFYGTTQFGGSGGHGTVFEITPQGAETVLYHFTGGNDGSQPGGALLQDKAGNFYGTTFKGGTHSDGTVFELGQSNGTWSETPLYSFTDNLDGANPYATLVSDKAGNLYGTTESGGVAGLGVVFKLAPDGTETVRHSFKGGTDGGEPFEGVTFNTDGFLYGATSVSGTLDCGCGTVFKVKP